MVTLRRPLYYVITIDASRRQIDVRLPSLFSAFLISVGFYFSHKWRWFQGEWKRRKLLGDGRFVHFGLTYGVRWNRSWQRVGLWHHVMINDCFVYTWHLSGRQSMLRRNWRSVETNLYGSNARTSLLTVEKYSMFYIQRIRYFCPDGRQFRMIVLLLSF